MSVVLVDMDGVLADWGREWDRQLELLDELGYDTSRFARHADQTTFNLFADLTPEEEKLVRGVLDAQGFYEDLRVIPGAKQAMHAMVDEGHEVFIVTSPWPTNPTCASAKLSWAMRMLGNEWSTRVVITSDKTIVQGDYLIDDKPEITGSQAPSWEHIWFTQPYNSQLTGQRRLDDWSQWKDMIR